MGNIIKCHNEYHNSRPLVLLVSQVGIGVLKDMQEKLIFAENASQRMEDEGGTALNH